MTFKEFITRLGLPPIHRLFIRRKAGPNSPPTLNAAPSAYVEFEQAMLQRQLDAESFTMLGSRDDGTVVCELPASLLAMLTGRGGHGYGVGTRFRIFPHIRDAKANLARVQQHNANTEALRTLLGIKAA